MKIEMWLAGMLACGIYSTTVLGQQGAAPRPAASGPSLVATMQILQSTLSEQGKMNWTIRYHDSADATNWTYAFSFEVSKVVADASACTISYHYKIVRDGAQVSDEDASFNLHDVQDLTLTTGDQRQDKNDAAAGHPTWTAKVDPPVFDLVVKGKETVEYYFFFFNQDPANRAMKAMGHAVELCGGSRGTF